MIRVEQVSFWYPEQENPTLQDITFSVNAGEFIVLCGQSGSGKSTLLRHLKKEQFPFGDSKGEVYIRGQRLQDMENIVSSQMIGYVGQSVEGQLVTDKVWHELAFGLENLGIPRREIQTRVAEIAEYFGISNWFQKSVDELSGGQQQIVSLAAVMVMQPKVLLLDEPTAQLDPIGAERFLQTVKMLNEDFGITVILSEQRLEQALVLADHVMILHEGRILGMVPSREVPKLLMESENKLGKELPVACGMPVGIRMVQKVLSLDKVETGTPLTLKEGKRWLASWCRKYQKREIETDTYNKKTIIKKDYAIVAKGLEYHYDKGQDVVKDLWANIPGGSIYAILGGNGVGKSTVLKLFCGIYRLKHGKLKVNGKAVYLPQNPQLMFSELTVEEELAEILLYDECYKGNQQKQLEVVEQMLQKLDLVEQRNQNPMDLSGGQAQRLAFGEALLLEADILCLDEPTKGLDAAYKKELGKMLNEFVSKGKTVVMVSHDLAFCAQYADYCSLLFQGQLVESEETKIFFQKNTFYTTDTRKLSNTCFPDCITTEELLHQMEVVSL